MGLRLQLSEKSKEELIDEIIELYKEKEKLERRLKKYENPNTPSSSNKHIKSNTQGLRNTGAKRGAPLGHKGVTFTMPDADIIIPVPAQECSHCHSKQVRLTGKIKSRNVLSIIKPQLVVKEYQQEEIFCHDCHRVTLAEHVDIPESGIYGKDVQSLVNYFKFRSRMSFELVTDAMESIFNVPMCESSALNVTRRASDKLEPLYSDLEIEAKKSDVVGADETSFSVNGLNHWVWVFCNKLFSLFKFNKERGGDIVEKTLGKAFIGKLVSDGWRTYEVYCSNNKVVHGRCWSHAVREVKFECKKKHPDLYKWFCDIFEMAKKGKAEPDKNKRIEWFEKCKAELSMWITHGNAHQNLRKLATKIKNGGDNWFMAVLYPELPLDNNEAERSLRPFVIMRKLVGCLRSDIGKRNYEVMMSLISTWQKQKKNVFYTLQATL